MIRDPQAPVLNLLDSADVCCCSITSAAEQGCAELRITEDLELGMAELQRIMQVCTVSPSNSAPFGAAAANYHACKAATCSNPSMCMFHLFSSSCTVQGNTQKGHTTGGFYGMSPPTRTNGAANPLGLDSGWRNTAYKATHSNLQALREMSVPSCLRNNANGDVLCIPESPDCGFLSAEFEVFDGDEEDDRASPASCMTHY